MANNILRDSGLADFDAELKQFTVNPRGAPKWIFLGHFAYKLSDIPGCFRSPQPSRSAFPSPVVLESFFMPTDNCLRLDEDQWLSPIAPDSCENNPKESISILEARFLRISL